MGYTPATWRRSTQLRLDGRRPRKRLETTHWYGARPCALVHLRRPYASGKALGERKTVFHGLANYSNSTEQLFPVKTARQDSIMDSGEEYEFELGGEVGLKASTKSRAVYEVLRVDNRGKNRRIYIKRRDLLRTHGLKPRDLRRVDPVREKESSQSIVIKDSAFLVSLLGVRCLIAEDQFLLFDPEHESAQKFLTFMTPKLRTAAGRSMIREQRMGLDAVAVNGQTIKSTNELVPTPFELEVLEGVMMVALNQMDTELGELLKRATMVLSAVPSEVNPMNLEELRRTKQTCVELESKAGAFRELLEEILDDEDELMRLNLSSRPEREDRIRQRERERAKREQGLIFQNAEDMLADMDDEEQAEQELEEVEDMLEYYMQRSATVQNEADRVLAGHTQSPLSRSNIQLTGARDLEESISVSLSARRFEVNRLELMLSMGSFAAALGAMFAGIFGMNLRSNLEMSMIGFYGITGLIVVGCFYIFMCLFLYTKKRRIV